MTEGFQDRLDGMRNAAQRHQEQAERVAARQRFEDYQLGQAIAANTIGRVASFGSTYEANTATLRRAVAQQPDTLTGRVAAAELADAAKRNEAITPDTGAEARRLAIIESEDRRLHAMTVSERIAAARARRNGRSVGIDRDREWD